MTTRQPAKAAKRTRKKSTAKAATVSQETTAPYTAITASIDWLPADLPIELIDRHPANRTVAEAACRDLAASIRATGKLLERVKVRRLGDRYQMLGGERRLVAHRINHWETIEAEVCACDDATARALVSLLNAHRRDLDPIETARDIVGLCLPAEEGGAGLTREQAAQAHGLASGAAASNLVRLLDLPAELLDLIAAGDLPQSYARLLLPYVQLPGLAAAVKEEVAYWKKEDTRPTRSDFEEWGIRDLIGELYRPMEPLKITKSVGRFSIYQGYKQKRLFQPTEKELDALAIVEIDGDQVATNCKLWDKLQETGRKETLDRIEQRDNPKKAKAAAAAKGEELTPAAKKLLAQAEKADAKRRAEEAAKRLADGMKAWRLRWLRDRSAAAIRQGDWRVGPLLLHLAATAKQRKGQWQTEPPPLADLLDAAAAIQTAKHGQAPTRKGRRSTSDLAELLAAMNDERDDQVAAAEELQARLLALMLWPQAPGHGVEYLIADQVAPIDWRPLTVDQRRDAVFLLEIDAATVEHIAGLFGVKLTDAWKEASRIKSDRERVAELLELHNRDQLGDLAQTLGPAKLAAEVAAAKRKSEAIDLLLANVHQLKAPKEIR